MAPRARPRARRCGPRFHEHRRRGLDLTRVEASAKAESERGDGVDRGLGAPDRSTRPVKRGQEPVAGRIDLVATIASEELPDAARDAVPATRPSGVAECGRPSPLTQRYR